MTATLKLADLRIVKARFARSANIERDSGAQEALSTFLPVGRAVDVIDRLAGALAGSGQEKALSITGPYGSGKSSLALLVDALWGPSDQEAFKVAQARLGEASQDSVSRVLATRTDLPRGYLRCFATAQREPIAATVLRAFLNGLQRATSADGKKLEAVSTRAAALAKTGTADVRQLTTLFRETAVIQPVILLIDEFGKNLEAAAGERAGSDLFLLQELAEASRDARFAIVTLQHMGYGDYASELSAAQRRDWAKVQGRFEEISYVEGSAQTVRLAASTFEPIADERLSAAVGVWASEQARLCESAGLHDLDQSVITATWPLHPTSVAVVPELVKRYGQNERTLFSFLAAKQPHSVAEWLEETTWTDGDALPSVPLSQLYDYFVDAATAMSGYSSAASRWLEIDTRIRDVRGLTAAQLKTLKTVGLLNLIAAGGELRASRAICLWALADGDAGTESAEAVGLRLDELTELGLLSWRDFSDEFRIWQGSDFDLRGAITRARQGLRETPVARLLNETVPLSSVVAARHSHNTGTLRIFERVWVDSIPSQEGLIPSNTSDGLVLFASSKIGTEGLPTLAAEDKPVVVVQVPDVASVIESARELAALTHVQTLVPKDDWVVIREVGERRAAARSRLDLDVDERIQQVQRKPAAFSRLLNGSLSAMPGRRTLSAILSEVADEAYSATPTVRNELLNRHDLSSQAAKARRELLQAILSSHDRETLGLEGFGPERAMYESVLRAQGIHTDASGTWRISAPPDGNSYSATWDRILQLVRNASAGRLRVDHLLEALTLPPYGVRAGLSPVLFTCVMLDQADVAAIYEHGTFKPSLTDDLLERLVRNPQHFEVKNFDTRGGRRAEALRQLAEALSPLVGNRVVRPSVVTIVGIMVQLVNALPEYAKRTASLSPEAAAVREAILSATEPDVLLFEALPDALGFARIIRGGRHLETVQLAAWARQLSSSLSELASLYEGLLETVAGELAYATASPIERIHSSLCEQANLLRGKVLDPRAAAFVNALATDLDRREWLEYVAMVVGHTPPAGWRDADVQRFRAAAAELAATYMRLAALHFDVSAAQTDGAFDALRVTVTAPGGEESARLVWLETKHASVVDDALEAAIQAIADTVGAERARDVLLARLASPTRSVGASNHDGEADEESEAG